MPKLLGGEKVILKLYQAATQVASPGPPWVIARISSNTAKANAVRRIRMMAMICCSIGR